MPSEWESMYVSSSERLTLEEVGRLGTSFQLFAIASKLLTGVFVDTHSPGLVLSGAILLCALINITMAFVTHNLLALTMLWGLNGFVSAVAWPALSRSFMQWFPDPKQRGTLYSFMSTNQSIGAALAPFIVISGTNYLGTWRAVLLAPGAIGVVIAAVVYFLVEDKEEKMQKKKKQRKTDTSSSASTSSELTSLLWKEVFTNPAVYMLGAVHMCTLLIRDGWSDLNIKYLTDENTWGYTQEETTHCNTMLHFGGFIGSILAGWASDHIYSGRRGPVIGLSIGSCMFPLIILWQGSSGYAKYGLNESTIQYIPSISFFFLGCFSFTPHVLLGLMAREIVSTKAQTTSASVAKLIAHFGGAMAGSPLGYVVETYGWDGCMKVLSTASMLGLCMMLPLWQRGGGVAPASPASSSSSSSSSAATAAAAVTMKSASTPINKVERRGKSPVSSKARSARSAPRSAAKSAPRSAAAMSVKSAKKRGRTRMKTPTKKEPPKYQVGQEIQARWLGGEEWYDGKIIRQGRKKNWVVYDVVYDGDGYVEKTVYEHLVEEKKRK